MSTQASRTERAYRTLLYFQQYGDGTKSHEETIIDLVTDLQHLADEYGEDWASVLTTSTTRYNAEKAS